MTWYLKNGDQILGPFEEGVVRSGLKSGFIDPKTTLFRRVESKSWISFERTPFNLGVESPIARIPPLAATPTNNPGQGPVLEDQQGNPFPMAPSTFPASSPSSTSRRASGLTGGETFGCLVIPFFVGLAGILVMKFINEQYAEWGLIVGFGGSALYFFYIANFKQRIWMGVGALAFGPMVSGMVNASHRNNVNPAGITLPDESSTNVGSKFENKNSAKIPSNNGDSQTSNLPKEYSGPFGFKPMMTIAELKALIGKFEINYNYGDNLNDIRLTTAPKPSSLIGYYLLVVSNDKVVSLRVGPDLQKSSTDLNYSFDGALKSLIQKYGAAIIHKFDDFEAYDWSKCDIGIEKIHLQRGLEKGGATKYYTIDYAFSDNCQNNTSNKTTPSAF
jgi:hypothetical protein